MTDDRTRTHDLAPTSSTLRLIVIDAERSRVIDLSPGDSIVGRAEQADVRLDDASVSKQHARLRVRPDGGVSVADLGSRNGTRLDGRPLTEEAALEPGEPLEIGRSTLVLQRGDGVLRRPPRAASTFVDVRRVALGDDTLVIADDATAYGEGLANEVEKTLKAAGIQIVAREKTNDKATDFKAILTKIKGRSPDAVFYGGMDATGGPMVKQARELGIKAAFSFGDGACTDEMAKLAGAAAEGLICSQAGLPASAASKGFNDAFKAKFGEVKQYAPFTYDSANLLIAAMQKADSADPAKYLPELAKISHKGATGTIEFDEKGDRKNAEITIFTLKGGKIEPIAVVQGGKSLSFEEFLKAAAPAAPAAAPATPSAPAPEAPKK